MNGAECGSGRHSGKRPTVHTRTARPHTVELPPFNTRSRDSRKDSFLGNDADWIRTLHRQGRRVGSRAGDRGRHRQQPRNRVGARRSIRCVGLVIGGRGNFERRLDDGCVGFTPIPRPRGRPTTPTRRAMTRTPTMTARTRPARKPTRTTPIRTRPSRRTTTTRQSRPCPRTPMRRSKTPTTRRTRGVDATTP